MRSAIPIATAPTITGGYPLAMAIMTRASTEYLYPVRGQRAAVRDGLDDLGSTGRSEGNRKMAAPLGVHRWSSVPSSWLMLMCLLSRFLQVESG